MELINSGTEVCTYCALIDGHTTLNACERLCPHYYSCDNVAAMNTFLSEKEEKEAERTFKICLHEHLERVIEVKAVSAEEALKQTEYAYKNGYIVLNADDFCEYSIETL